jgi:acetyl esterase
VPDTPPAVPFLLRLRGAAARAAARLPEGVQRRLSGRPTVEIDGVRLDATFQLLLAARRSGVRNPLTAGNPEEARARFRRELLSVAGPPTPVGAVREISVDGGDGPLVARHYAPPADGSAGGDGRPPPLLVFLHGGGFMLGDLDTHDEVCRLLCLHGRQHVLSVAYRLAPEHPFPAGVDDGRAALRWAQEHAAELGADRERVAVGGDSAGANLSAVVAQATAHDRPPAAQLLIYPPTDRTRRYPSHDRYDEGLFLSMADREAFTHACFVIAGAPAEDPRTSPLLAAELGGLPPALVAIAGFDVLRDEGEAYAAALLAAGTRCEVIRAETLPHGFVQLTGVSRTARRATIRMAERWGALLDSLPVGTSEAP